jgi:hypothetical protein
MPIFNYFKKVLTEFTVYDMANHTPVASTPQRFVFSLVLSEFHVRKQIYVVVCKKGHRLIVKL